MRIAEQRQARGVTGKELAAKVAELTGAKVDKTLISKFENLACLPTADVLTAMCHALNCGKLDLYDLEEIDLISDIPQVKPVNAPTKRKYTKRANIYNLTVRLDRGVLQVLNKHVLQMFGYKDITDYITKCVDRLIKRYNKKAAASAGTLTADKATVK